MNWKQRYAAKSYLRSALWIIPLVALVLEQISIRLASTFDASLTWVPRLARTAAGTAGALDTVVTLDISFIVFTFGSMLVAIQVASGQMTPRIIATALLRDNFIRCIVGLFIFSLLFAAGTKGRIRHRNTPILRDSLGTVRHRLNNRLPVLDRLYRTHAQTRRDCLAHRRTRDTSYRNSLSANHPAPTRSHQPARIAGPFSPNRRTPRYLSNRSCREYTGPRDSGTKCRQHHRIRPSSW